MRRPRQLFRLLLIAALVAPAAIATGSVATATTVPTLVGVRAAHHPGYDRIVFDFAGGLPSTRSVRYVRQLIADPSGLPIPIAGRAILQVTMSQTNAHNSAGQSTAPTTVAFAAPNVMTAVRSGDFEAITTYGIGLAKEETFTVSTLANPDRLVIDVKAAFPTVPTKVWLFNEAHFNVGTEPYYTPVLRPVQPLTAATGVMDRIFAGPLPAEHANGLRALLSGATGFSHMTIINTVARVRLTGGCSVGGSTASIAGQIMPSLRQLSTVDFVKIYDPSGHTERLDGLSDSIPVCLEP